MFAIVIERAPLHWTDVPGGLLVWAQVVGGFSAFGLLLWLLLGLPRMRPEDRAQIPTWRTVFFILTTSLAFLGYFAYALVVLANARAVVQDIVLLVAGVFAIIAVGLPFLLNLPRWRFRRIFGLAKLSFKEAIRRRVLYAFSGMLLVFLFASWFVPQEHKDQVRTYVSVVFTAMSILLLLTASLLAAFSIPADIKLQTIHTIVTKPVERFEIVLGRFLGFLALITLVLVVMTGVSLMYVLRGIHPEAAAESLKARDPLFGELRFENTDREDKGTNVGREWDYRSHITRPTPGQKPQTARWDFATVPAALGDQKEVRCEYTFDIYRTTKGDEGRDVACTFRFFSWRYREGNDEAFRKERKERTAGTRNLDVDNALAEKYGYYELNAQPVTDYRTMGFSLPAGIFRNVQKADAEREQELSRRAKTVTGGGQPARFQVRVTCDSPTQFVGMAQYDFYLLQRDPGESERLLFAINFFKGAFGLWAKLVLVIGVAVVLSTYLNGVISWMVTGVYFIGGMCREFIETVATGKNFGGGPMEAMVRIAQRQLSSPGGEDSSSIGDQIVGRSDEAFRWVMKRVINIIPDVELFDLTNYVAEGFNIPTEELGVGLVLLFCGYLLPAMVLAFYLIRWREVASTQ